MFKLTSPLYMPSVLAVTVMLVSAIFMFMPLQAVFAAPSCPLSNQTGRTIVNFDGSILVSDGSGIYQTSAILTSPISRGTYDITLVSYDNHAVETATQDAEQWFIIMKNANGNVVGSSQAISDLSNGQNTRIETVNTDYRVIMPTTAIVARHAGIYGQNSVTPVCVAFDMKDGSPLVTTDAASLITNDEAVLHGNAHANGTSDVTGWFEWGTLSWLGSKTNEIRIVSTYNMSARLTGLNRDTQYYFRAAARNAVGTSYGPILYFSTAGGDVGSGGTTPSPSPSPYPSPSSSTIAPTVSTQSPTFVAQNTVVLNGYGVTNSNVSTYAWFEWGVQPSLGFSTARKNIGYISSTSTNFADSLTGLSPNTSYYFRAVAENTYGRNYGSVLVLHTRGIENTSSVSSHGGSSSRMSDTFSIASDMLFNLIITPSDEMLPVGKIIPFVISFENVAKRPLRDAVLVVTLPSDVSFQKISNTFGILAKDAVVSGDMQTITFAIGNVAPDDKGFITVEALLKEGTVDKKVFTTKVEMTYTDSTRQASGKGTAFAVNTATSPEVNSAGVVFAGGIFLWLVWGLLGLILLLLLLFLLKRRRDNEEKRQNKK